jgi:hypothetical protein
VGLVQSAEEAEFDEPGLARVDPLELGEGVMDPEDVGVRV